MGDRSYGHLVRAVLAQHWAISRDSLAWAAICEIVAMREAGLFFSIDEIRARVGEAAAVNGPRGRDGSAGAVAVGIVPIYGVIAPRSSLMASSGGTSAEAVAESFRAHLRDDDVAGIVLDVDSPGGVVSGIDELATEIREARGIKPIVAIAHHEMNSAAYYIGSSADEIVATPSAQVGSIGVFTAHDDLTAAREELGIKRTVVSAGKYKAEGALNTELDEDAVAYIQGQVDELYGMFVSAVAKGRGISAGDVRSGYGEGRVVLAKQALELGMVDRVDTFEATLKRVARGQVKSREARASITSGVALVEPDPAATTDPDVAAVVHAAAEEAAAAAVDPTPNPDADRRRRLSASRASAALAVAHVRIPATSVAEEVPSRA